jgi:hypothetical protein
MLTEPWLRNTDLEGAPQKLVLLLVLWGSGLLLLTGDRCLKVVVNTGLTVCTFKALNE